MSEEIKAVTIPGELYAFLMGEGEIDGTSFGDLNANLPGRFWWRALLRTAARSTPTPTEDAVERVEFELRREIERQAIAVESHIPGCIDKDAVRLHGLLSLSKLAKAALAAIPPAGRVEEMRQALLFYDSGDQQRRLSMLADTFERHGRVSIQNHTLAAKDIREAAAALNASGEE